MNLIRSPLGASDGIRDKTRTMKVGRHIWAETNERKIKYFKCLQNICGALDYHTNCKQSHSHSLKIKTSGGS